MLTAMVAVDNILAGIKTKANLWEINTEQDYHEDKGDHAGTSTHTDSNSEHEFAEEEVSV